MANSEKAVFRDLQHYSQGQLLSCFDCHFDGKVYHFTQKGNPSHYVTVAKTRCDGFTAVVNANFGFSRPAGSNNYPILIEIGHNLTDAFGYTVEW